MWSIYNEPNLGFQLAPQATAGGVELSGRMYRELVQQGWTALHETGHGGDTILIGELGPAGSTFAPGMFNAMAPLRFLRALYCVDSSYRPLQGTAAAKRGCPTTPAASQSFKADNPGLFQASGFADHPYTQGLPPNEPIPNEPDYAVLADIGRLQRTLDSVQRAYGSHKAYPIYSTEYGYQTTPPDTQPGSVSPAIAAYYLNWSEYITWTDPRLRSYDQYLLIDTPRGLFSTALRFPNGAEKPSYAAFRMPLYLPVTETKAGDPLEVWGCVRPAHDAQLATHHPQTVQIQFQPGSGGAFKTVSAVKITDRYGYFEVRQRFHASGRVRLAWNPPHGPAEYSRTVDITLS
jgi:hypothetical protein